MKPRAQPFALEIAGLTNLEWDGKIRPGAGGAIVLRAGDATVAGAAGRPATARYEAATAATTSASERSQRSRLVRISGIESRDL